MCVPIHLFLYVCASYSGSPELGLIGKTESVFIELLISTTIYGQSLEYFQSYQLTTVWVALVLYVFFFVHPMFAHTHLRCYFVTACFFILDLVRLTKKPTWFDYFRQLRNFFNNY